MENVVLVIHLILALSLIGMVLMQRSEGGGLGIGGGGGANGSRAGSTAMGKATWVLAIGFIITSIALTIIAAEKSAGASVIDRLGAAPAVVEDVVTPDPGDSLLPPAADDAPLVPAGQ